MKRFASTRSEKPASHAAAGRAQCKVGSMDEDGMRYGFTTQALMASTIATAPAIVTTQSITTRGPWGSPCVRRSTGLREWRRGGSGGACSSGASTTGGTVAVALAGAFAGAGAGRVMYHAVPTA